MISKSRRKMRATIHSRKYVMIFLQATKSVSYVKFPVHSTLLRPRKDVLICPYIVIYHIFRDKNDYITTMEWCPITRICQKRKVEV